jgi:hypothetical protein
MAIAQYEAGDPQAARAELTEFVDLVRAQAGKKIAVPLAKRLVANANAIASTIRCK